MRKPESEAAMALSSRPPGVIVPMRLTRDGLLDSDSVNQLDFGGEVFYRRLLNVVDDYGLHDARLGVLLSAMYPLRIRSVTETHIAEWLSACENAGLVCVYKSAGKPYLFVFNTRWQAKSAPRCPFPTEADLYPLASVTDRNGKLPKDVDVDKTKPSDTSLRSVSAGDPELIKEEVWRIGKIMFEKQGVGPKMSGSYLGMLIKHHGEEQVLAALRQGIEQQPADLKSWLRGVLRPKPATRTAVRLKAGDTIYGEQTHEQQSDQAPAERDITGESHRLA